MCQQDESIIFSYLDAIIEALRQFYTHDRLLLQSDRHTHEQTISFRVAMYLAKILEPQCTGLFVDCEYHGDIHNPYYRKVLNGTQRVRPDIIFHNRDTDNRFCIEMKIHSMQDDYKKIHGFIDYGFQEGYCIYNIGENRVSINALNSSTRGKGIRYTYKFCESTKQLVKQEKI